MKGLKKKLKRNWLYVLMCAVPYVLGVLGYIIDANTSIADALFSPIALYAINITSTSPNICVEIARWWGALVTLSFLVTVLADWSQNIDDFIQTKIIHRGKTLAIYCDDDEWDNFEKQLIKDKKIYPIRGRGSKLACANSFLLMGDEKQNLEFISMNKDEIQGRSVYMRCTPMFARTVNHSDYVSFCDEENAAREYWKKHPLYNDAIRNNEKFILDVSIVGHSDLMEELLLWSLQVNIFSKYQKITYHLFGDWERFLSVHHELDQILWDTVVFEGLEWHSRQSVLKVSDRILVWSDNDVYDIRYSIPGVGSKLHYMCDELVEYEDKNYFDGRRWFPYPDDNDNVIYAEPVVFYWKQYASDIHRILNRSNIKRGMRLNEIYNEYNDGNTAWNDLDVFTQYSNISSASYSETWKYMAGRIMNEFPDRWMDIITECEHERWCRYHYICNWTVEPDDTTLIKDSIKNKKERGHNCLVPFNRLHQFMIDNDKRNIQYLSMMIREDTIGVMEDMTSMPVQTRYIVNNLRYYKRKDKTSDVVFEACIVPAFVHFDNGNEAGLDHSIGDVFIRAAGTSDEYGVMNGVDFEETFVEVYRA